MTEDNKKTKSRASHTKQSSSAFMAAGLALPLSFSAMAAAADDNAVFTDMPMGDAAHFMSVDADDAPVLHAQMQTGGDPVVTAPAANGAVDPAATNASAFSLMAPMAVGPVTFGAPWVLLGFLSFPLLWRLMRSTPPAPRRETFAPIRLLFNLKSEDQEPAKMPLWQRLMRLALAGTIITAMADPSMNPDAAMSGDGPVVIMVDNGWASAPDWEERRRQISILLEQAEQDNRPVSLISTAMPADGGGLVQTAPVSAANARDILASIQPQAWPVDRAAAMRALEVMQEQGALGGASVYWLSNGLEDDLSAEFGQTLADIGGLNLYLPDDADALYMLSEPSYEGEVLRVDVQRSMMLGEDSAAEELMLTAYDELGRPLMQAPVTFEAGEDVQTASFQVPVEVRNDIARIGINGHRHAGATLLMDERWRLRPVGVFETPADQGEQDLLREDSYVSEALNPHADLMRGSVDEIMSARDQSVIVMPDAISLSEDESVRLQEWVEGGGTLLRFAGPRLAQDVADGVQDPLLPVPLRPGVRVLDENFAGSEPQGIGRFTDRSPLADVTIRGEAEVTRQILPEPTPELSEHVWAELEDGTPLITARQMGEGWTVLVHTTSNTDWSDFVLSGTFVDVMRGIVAHSQGLDNGLLASGAIEPPLQSLDTQGRLAPPPPAAESITSDVVEGGTVSARFPAGYYGTETAKFAHNIAASVTDLEGLNVSAFTGEVSLQNYDDAFNERNLKGMLLTAAFMLALTDMGVMLGQRGALPMQRRRRKTAKPRAA